MSFMVGKAPIRRTIKYLEKGKIVFRENVKIFTVNFNDKEKHDEGARDFVFWHLPQIQYKNPTVQCLTLKNITPSPFIRIFLDKGESVIIDCDSRSQLEIHDHLQNFTALCKSVLEIKDMEKKFQQTKSPTQYFGFGCQKHCICEVFGQVPCSSLVNVPKVWKQIKPKHLKYVIPPQYMDPLLLENEEEDK